MSKLPNRNLHGYLVRNTLNRDGGRTDNVHGSKYRKTSAINEWSKFKPVVSPKIIMAEDDEERWRGANRQCGFTIPRAETMASFRSALEDGSALWSYTPPRGGTTEPMRMGDYRGYNPDAVCPLGDFITNGISENGSNNVYGDVTFAVDVLDNLEDNIMYGDISIDGTPLTDFYLGIYAWDKSGIWIFKTNKQPLGVEYNFNVTIPMTTKEWNVIPFFCSVPQDSIEGEESQGIYVSANVPAKKVTIISSNDKVVFIVFGVWNSDKTSVRNIHITVKNNTNDNRTLDRISVSLFGTRGNVDNNVGDPAYVYYKGNSSNTLTIPPMSEVYTEIGDFSSIRIGDTGEYERYYLMASGYEGDTLYHHTFEIEEEQDTPID